MKRIKLLSYAVLASLPMQLLGCKVDEGYFTAETPVNGAAESSQELADYSMERTLSDEAQLKTIAFDGLAFMTNNLGAQSFYPPGKVADYSGFQYLRDNDPTEMGHNTDFVTVIAFNVMHILSDEQLYQMIVRAENQIDLINQYAYQRFPLMQAFRRQLKDDVPAGVSGLDLDAVTDSAAGIYRTDGLISYDRAELLGGIIRAFSAEQHAAMKHLQSLGGVRNWDSDLSNPLAAYDLQRDVNVAVMTYASELYSWYVGSAEADAYFCPERQGTYFGSFYLKDWPAMGNPDYTINEQLTATAGEDFLAVLTNTQRQMISGLVDTQREDLLRIAELRKEIASELRGFMSQESIDQQSVLTLSEEYGQLDGAIAYHYATQFSAVYDSLTDEQIQQLQALVDAIGYQHPDGAFLYSSPVEMPDIDNTDYFFE